MKCPWCATVEDRVVDSREVEQGEAIRRRRECIGCGRRFTTYERTTEAVVWVLKRSGQKVPFERSKVVAGVRAACKNRPVQEDEIISLAVQVEEAMREQGPQATSEQIGRSVLDCLRLLDDVAAVRFASVYKGFEDVGDFARELGLQPPPSDGTKTGQ
ncbi:MAG: transcriptional regulator NrdR [Acidimicrobiales bacterium]